MYREFYGLRDKPFDIVPNPSVVYESEKHGQALTYLRYGFTENIGFILFTGEIGTGKTTLIKYLLSEISDDVEVAVVFNTNVSADELLRLILIELEVDGVGPDKSRNLDLLNDHLINVYRQGRRCLLIIDEAQNLSPQALEEVRLLSNLQAENQPLLQIILAGQPELRDIIRSPGLEQLAQRVAITYHLTALSREELSEYVTYRLKLSGGTKKLFNEDALDVIFERSKGIPRSVNILCNAALVYGYADGKQVIGPDIVRQIVDDNIGVGLSDAEPAIQAVPAGAEGDYGQVLQRMAGLEGQVAKLAAQVNWQAGQLDGTIGKGHDKLIQSLKTLLEVERQRSEKYYARYVALFAKNKTLQNQMDLMRASKRNTPYVVPEEAVDIEADIEDDEGGKGFLRSLFGSLFG